MYILNAHFSVIVFCNIIYRTRLSLKDTSERNFGAAKVAQIIQKDIEELNRDNAVGTYESK